MAVESFKTIQKFLGSTRTGVMKLTIDLPDRVNANIDKRYALEALVATLYWNAKLSGREARDILGVSRREFEEILPQYGLSILVDSPDNIDTELASESRRGYVTAIKAQQTP